MELTLSMVALDRDGVPETVRKGKGVPHYLRAQPPVFGSVSVDTLCGRSLGRSSDGSLVWGSGAEGVCRSCVRVWERLSAAVASVEPVGVPGGAPVAASAPVTPLEGVLVGAERDAYVQWWADALLHGALVDLLRIKASAARAVAGGRVVAGGSRRGRRAVQAAAPMSCVNPVEGEPVKVKHKVAPVEGSVRDLVAGAFQGESITHGLQSGSCPFCLAHVPLSRGVLTAHVRGAESVPQPKTRLADRQTAPVDTGARVGDPEAGDKRRGLDMAGVFERGMVPGHDLETLKPLKDADGHQIDVPATAVNVRAVLEYWKRKRINRPKDGAKPEAFDRWRARQANQTERVRTYTRMLRAFEGAPAPRYDTDTGAYAETVARNVPLFECDPDTGDVSDTGARDRESVRAARSPEGLASDHTRALGESPVSGAALTVSQMVPGPASYKGRATPTMAGPVTVSRVGDAPVEPAACEDTRTGWAASAGTMAGPLGAERMDHEVTGPRPRAHQTRAQAAHYRKKMRRKASKGLVPVKGALKANAREWSRGLHCGHLAGEGCGCA